MSNLWETRFSKGAVNVTTVRKGKTFRNWVSQQNAYPVILNRWHT